MVVHVYTNNMHATKFMLTYCLQVAVCTIILVVWIMFHLKIMPVFPQPLSPKPGEGASYEED